MKTLQAIVCTVCFAAAAFSSFAQRQDRRVYRDEETRDQNADERHGFRSDRMFVGGSIALGLGGGSFAIGGNPEVGYSVAEWFDAGISTNLIYTSITAESNQGWSEKSFNYGGGVFMRLYPIKELFVQAIPEYNWIKNTARYVANGYEVKQTVSAPSFLLGAGYCSREVGRSSFYMVIMFDLGNNINSPYIGALGSKFPILRSGFNVYLGRKKR